MSQQRVATNLNTLPAELVHNICQHLDRQDVCSLRATCTWVEPIAASYLFGAQVSN